MRREDALRREVEALRHRLSRLSAAGLRLNASLDFNPVLHGFSTSTPQPAEAPTSLVATRAPRERAMAAIWAVGLIDRPTDGAATRCDHRICARGRPIAGQATFGAQDTAGTLGRGS